MAEKLEDLNLPNATVAKIIKETLPEAINVGKDARAAISRAASVFVLYLTSQASNEAQRAKRKTLLGQDVIKALEELEFDDFVDPLQEILKGFKEAKAKNKATKGNKTAEDEITMGEEAEEQDANMEEQTVDE
ncbi:DNA polymerase epsilon subunit 3 [Cylas formicarius]|uniref:DNA polymerase epsilon subunit 3 n=1 Tax=Cylas formicarius TaxID=197179 RepID=UPI00295843C7|nr:DNA polymerase epsilon subunit 3 [Cylas formicarius]